MRTLRPTNSNQTEGITMLKIISTLTVLSTLLFSALPPRYQNEKDLNVMVEFVKSHAIVMNGLSSIDFDAKIVHYNQKCKIYFKRKSAIHPKGWVGPAETLVFDRASCKY